MLPGPLTALSAPWMRRRAEVRHAPLQFSSRGRRLHAEQLEDRRMMNADDSVGIAASLALNFDADRIIVANAPQAAAALPASPSEADLRAWFRAEADRLYGSLFGASVSSSNYPWYGWLETSITDDVVFRANLQMLSLDSAPANLFLNSTDATNVQVAGVDEADLVEADGERMFLLRDDELLIFRADGETSLALQSRVKLDQPAGRMILHGDRLAIISEQQSFSDWRYRSTTTVQLLDVADPSSPALVQKTEIDGRLLDLRAIDGKLVLVVEDSPKSFNIPAPRIQYAPVQIAPLELIEAPSIAPLQPILFAQNSSLSFIDVWRPTSVPGAYETRAEYLAHAEDEFISQFTEGWRSYNLAGELIASGDQWNVSVDELSSGRHERLPGVQVVSFDMHSDSFGPVDHLRLAGAGDVTVYATRDSMYVFAAQGSLSQVTKIDLNSESGKLREAARGTIEGTLVNQFAADERDGVLRVVVTTENRSHGVVTLEQTGRKLKVLGSVMGLAPWETLHTVNFTADEVYFVTFRQVDPLFVVDLTDPAAPLLKGELEIPGYSERLITIDESHQLGIGRDANGAWFGELQLSLFDVSDPQAPVRTHIETIAGGRTTSTEVTGNRWLAGDGDHHALTYFAEMGILALPVQTENDWTAGAGLFDPGEGGLLLYRIDPTEGFTFLGTIEHDDPVRRTVRVGEVFYAVSHGSVTAHTLDDPATTLETFVIADAAPGDYTALTAYVGPNAWLMQDYSLSAESAESAEEGTTPSADGARVSWAAAIGSLAGRLEKFEPLDFARAAWEVEVDELAVAAFDLADSQAAGFDGIEPLTLPWNDLD